MVQKIKDETLRVRILNDVEDIIYSNDLVQGEAKITWINLKIVGLQDDPQASNFINYFEETWSGKTIM